MERVEKPIVLVVDDEENILRSLKRLFKGEPFATVVTTDPVEALGLMRRAPVTVLVSDLRMPELDGDHLIAQAKALDKRIVCIRLTGYSDPEASDSSPAPEAVFATVTKPWDDGEITTAVRHALERYRRAAGREATQTNTSAPHRTHRKEIPPCPSTT